MKKKIILASLMVAILACLFAISLSAAELIDGIYYTFSGTEATVSGDNQKKCTLEDVVIPEKVTFEGTEYTVTAIAHKAFGSQNANGGNGKVKNVTIPATVTTVGTYAFANCPEIKTVDCKSTKISERMFFDCNKLDTLTLENTVQIDSYAFTRIAISSLILPSTLETLNASAFKGITALTTVVVLGPALGANAFESCGKITKLVLTESFVTFPSNSANGFSNSLTTYYTGTDHERIKTLCSSTSRFKDAGYCSYGDYVNGNYTSKTCMVIYDTNLCVAAFDGVHTEPQDDGNCETAVVCSVCADYTYKEAKEHKIAESLVYTSLMAEGEYSVGCTNECCTYGTKEKADALYSCSGFSSPLDGRGEIAIGYAVNLEAIKEYERVMDTTLTYGVFAVLKNKLGDGDVFENGKAVDGVINAEVDRCYVAFEFKITGFETEEHKSIELAIGAYAIDGNGNVSYMQVFAPEANAKYSFVSYNDVVKSSVEE